MENLKGYATYHIFNTLQAQLIRDIRIDEKFYFDSREDPSFMNWVDKDGYGTTSYQIQPENNDIENMLLNNFKRANELIIYAQNEDMAEDIRNLVHGGRLLGYPSLYDHPSIEYIMDLEHDFVFYERYKQNSICENMVFACLVAIRAWESQNLIYCIEKYRFSLQLDSFSPHSASPKHGQVFFIGERGHSYHVTAAYAFLSAYSIIEELGLEIRSSSKKPRFLNSGDWNPVVKEDVLQRLSKVGISSTDTMTWLIRGKPSQLYNSIKPKLGFDSKWNDGEEVHDPEMYIFDAIHYCSYIRNFFVAHKFDEVIRYINPYDIHNVQMLARRLILGKLGLWKFDEENPEKYIIS
ncbi:hypothetical protein BN988_02851 [Oceanobacillus picturae]|uniref:Uncharacterized protein n=1 Tax=Oceanobacillus picturae TaxID=171693 RepID=W9AN09_9BACI|nr:hypothetical protein [Oceanobacillus picturae]CDO04297.1 hypothetical protein BN988_02851 [Oceanobacillus picturae]